MPTYYLQAKAWGDSPRMVLDLNVPAKKVIGWEKNNGVNQRWDCTRTGTTLTIRNSYSGEYLIFNNGNVGLSTVLNSNAQWTVEDLAGSVGVRIFKNHLALNLLSSANGAAVTLTTRSGRPEQTWGFLG